MELGSLFSLQFQMFAELFAGYCICRMRILQPGDRTVLTKLVINLLLPCSIVSSFSLTMTADVVSRFLLIFAASLAIQAMQYFLANVLYRKVRPEAKPVMQYATICSNAGFLGNAVCEGVYGTEGLMYGQIYLIPQRIVMWTAGVSCFADKGGSIKDTIRTLVTHPCIIAVFIGIVKMALGIDFPSPVTSVLSALGKCSTPLIMIFLGMVLAETGFAKMITKDTLFFSAVRLVLIPLITLAAVCVLHLDSMIGSICVLLVAMPAGTTTAILAEQYNRDVEFAANVVILTTILSIGLLPVWCIFLNSVL